MGRFACPCTAGQPPEQATNHQHAAVMVAPRGTSQVRREAENFLRLGGVNSLVMNFEIYEARWDSSW